jgi:hypothetical protein
MAILSLTVFIRKTARNVTDSSPDRNGIFDVALTHGTSAIAHARNAERVSPASSTSTSDTAYKPRWMVAALVSARAGT